MSTPVATSRVDAVVAALPASAFVPASRRGQFNRLEDREFQHMQTAYSGTGGLVSGTDASHRLRRHCDQPLSTLARWIVARTIVSFEWRSHILVPLFQFEPLDMTLRAPVVEVMRELADALDAWETALWFALPNAWLDDEAPVDVILREPLPVLDAARADRFIARG